MTTPEAVATAEPAATTGTGAPTLFSMPGEPQAFLEYAGQEHITDYLDKAVRGLIPQEQALEPQLLLGLAGMGKTLLAKVIANELGERAAQRGLVRPRFFEVFPADLENLTALDTVMERVLANPGSVLFIDEVHDLQGPLSRKLYLLLAENRYLRHGDATPAVMPPTTLLAATTDYGQLHPALKRRWHKHFLKPATREQLVGYVLRRPYGCTRTAAERIVARTRFSGAPWEALEVQRVAVTNAKARGASVVDVEDVEWAFGVQELDDLGLRYLDRQVVAALLGQPKTRTSKGTPEFVCYAASEQTTCMLAGIDTDEYRETVKPRLMSRGLMEVRPYYGQALTPKAVELYAHLRQS